MTLDSKKQGGLEEEKPLGGVKGRRSEPGWANGLKQFYNSVVDEDLPDSFRDLLSQLDKDEKA